MKRSSSRLLSSTSSELLFDERLYRDEVLALTCAGVPCLDKPPDDCAALVTGLFHTFALFLGKAMLQDNS